MQKEVNQEESEQNEVEGTKMADDSTSACCSTVLLPLVEFQPIDHALHMFVFKSC